MKKMFTDNNSGIAYGVSLVVVTMLVLGVGWVSMSPVADEIKTVTDDLNAQNPDIYTDNLVKRVDFIYNIWGYLLTIFMGVFLIFILVRSIRMRAVD